MPKMGREGSNFQAIITFTIPDPDQEGERKPQIFMAYDQDADRLIRQTQQDIDNLRVYHPDVEDIRASIVIQFTNDWDEIIGVNQIWNYPKAWNDPANGIAHWH